MIKVGGLILTYTIAIEARLDRDGDWIDPVGAARELSCKLPGSSRPAANDPLNDAPAPRR